MRLSPFRVDGVKTRSENAKGYHVATPAKVLVLIVAAL
jgi:hypothetical protein